MVSKKQKRINWILVAVLLVLSVFFLFPVIWMLANSFKPDAAITADMNSVAAFVPPAPDGNFFDNYIEIITNTSFLRYMGQYAPLRGDPDRPWHHRERTCRVRSGKDSTSPSGNSGF